MTLRARILLGYIALLVLFGFVLAGVLVEMRGTEARLAALSAGYLPLAREIAGAEAWPIGLELEADQGVERLLRVRTSENFVTERMDQQLRRASEIARAMEAAALWSESEEPLQTISAQIETTREALQSYRETHTRFVELAQAAPVPSGDDLIPELLRLRRQVEVNLRVLSRRLARRTADVVDLTEKSQRDAQTAAFGLSAAAFAIGLFLLISTHFTLRPIRRLIATAERIRQGDRGERAEVQAGDEVGRLAVAFNAMAAALEERERKLELRTCELEGALADLRQSQEALIRTERLATIGQMAAQIAHEVRNPLNALGLNVDLLAEELGPEPGEEALSTVGALRNEVQRLTAITESYLSLGRKAPLRLASQAVGSLLSDLVQFQREELERAGVSIQMFLPSPAAEVSQILVDADQLRQAFLNILKNAGEALGAQGGGDLAIEVRARGEGVEVVFSDDGPGMDAEHVGRVFDPFFSTKARGSGLGLPLTHQVIAEHGGRIECSSRPGEGTTFTVWLPGAASSAAGLEGSVSSP